jgi:hypothetical protein
MSRFAGTQHAQTFPQSSFSWETLSALPSEVSSFSGYVSLMRLSYLIKAQNDTHCHSLRTGLWNPYRCLSSSVLPISEAMHHIHNHCHEIAPAHYTSTNWRWTSVGAHIRRAKTEIHCVLPIFSHVCSRPAILIMIVRRSDKLTMGTCDCMTTQTCYTCPLHGETCCDLIF